MRRSSAKGFHSLEHRLWREMRSASPVRVRLLVAVSGGVDSMALLSALVRLRRLARLQVRVAHIHHGACRGRQGRFRDEAWAGVRAFCQAHEVPFVSNLTTLESRGRRVKRAFAAVPPATGGENEWRSFRYEWLQRWREPDEWLVMAHHADDLLETRLIRLIRGTGPQGLAAMRTEEFPLWRPLLEVSRAELFAYAVSRNLPWWDDPSNRCEDPLRNWLRQRWLPSLERKRPGALTSLARSLSLILAGLPPQESVDGASLDVRELQCQRPEAQRRILAAFLKSQALSNYSHRHVEELRKRLAAARPGTFRLLGAEWTLDRLYLSRRNAEGIVPKT